MQRISWSALDGEPVLWIVPRVRDSCCGRGRHRCSRTGVLDMLLRGHGAARRCTSRARSTRRLRAAGARSGRRCGRRSSRCASQPATSRGRWRWPRARRPDGASCCARRSRSAATSSPRRAAGLAALAAGGDAPAPRRTTRYDARRRAGHGLRALRDAAGDARRARAARRRRAARASSPARVIGQPEAVECVVERIALLKAGLTDPDAAAGRAAVRRPDRHGQDRDRQGARRVPVRLAATG